MHARRKTAGSENGASPSRGRGTGTGGAGGSADQAAHETASGAGSQRSRRGASGTHDSDRQGELSADRRRNPLSGGLDASDDQCPANDAFPGGSAHLLSAPLAD